MPPASVPVTPVTPATPAAATTPSTSGRSFRLHFANGAPAVGGRPLGLPAYATVSEARRAEVAGHVWRWQVTNAARVAAGAPAHVTVTRPATAAERAAGQGAAVQLNRSLLGLRPGDGRRARHLNGDRLDCRDANLREVDAAGAAVPPRRLGTAPPPVVRPRGRKNTLGLVGVARSASVTNPYLSVTWVPSHGKGGGKRVYLGLFGCPNEAALAHDVAVEALRGVPGVNRHLPTYRAPDAARSAAIRQAVETRISALRAA